MSLLEKINERNGARQAQVQGEAEAQQQEAGQAQEAALAEARKPDADVARKTKRAEYGQMIQAGEDRDLQDEPATPEEQQVFTDMEIRIGDMLNGRNGAQLLNIVSSAGDPVEGIGQAAHDVITLLDQQNPGVDREILAALGESAVEQLVEAVEESNPRVNLDEDQMAEAYSLAVQEWMTNHPDEVDDDMQDYMAGAAPEQLSGGHNGF